MSKMPHGNNGMQSILNLLYYNTTSNRFCQVSECSQSFHFPPSCAVLQMSRNVHTISYFDFYLWEKSLIKALCEFNSPIFCDMTFGFAFQNVIIAYFLHILRFTNCKVNYIYYFIFLLNLSITFIWQIKGFLLCFLYNFRVKISTHIKIAQK